MLVNYSIHLESLNKGQFMSAGGNSVLTEKKLKLKKILLENLNNSERYKTSNGGRQAKAPAVWIC